MKRFDLAVISGALLFSGYAFSVSDVSDSQQAVFDRLKHPAAVCVKGEACDPAKAVPEETVAALPGEAKYAVCAACHGANGEGGVGPKLSGQSSDMIVEKLTKYKNNETIGAQSALMWGQAAGLTEQDMRDLGDYVETL